MSGSRRTARARSAIGAAAMTAVGLGGTAASAQGTVTLTISTWDTGNALVAYDEGVKAFEKIRPDIKVSIESINNNYYESKLLADMAAGDAPDLMLVADQYVPEMVKNGDLLASTGGARPAGVYARASRLLVLHQPHQFGPDQPAKVHR
jgi:ABC-type glycerol-3-phosphate transport system substrate-binding protein